MYSDWLLVLHAPLIALSQLIRAHGTDVSDGVASLSGETLLQEKNSTGHRWDSNPGPYRQHSHCCKHTKPLYHLHFSFYFNVSRDERDVTLRRSTRLSTAETQRRKSLVGSTPAVKTYGDDEADVLIDSSLKVTSLCCCCQRAYCNKCNI